jgi:hypothetical protein
MQFILPFATAYPRKVLPKGCRSPRLEYPLVKDYAAVTEIQPDEAAVAFRLHYAVAQPFGASRSHRSTLELLFHNNDIWWPNGGTLYAPTLDIYRGQRLSYRADANEWRTGIGRNPDMLKAVPKGKTVARTETESRVEFPDGAGETVARVQRSLTRNYLICGGFVYVRGGPPIYAQWKGGNRRTLLVTSSGCDRNVTDKHDFYSPPAYFETFNCQQACFEGRFWLPGSEDEVTRRLTKSQFAYPSIEVCIPDLIYEELRLEIQVDALFRETARLLRPFLFYALRAREKKRGAMPSSAPGSAKEFTNMIQQKFKQAVEPRTDPQATTALRTEAMRSLLDCELQLPRRRVRGSAVLPCLRAFQDLERRHPRDILADEDVKALADIVLLP